MANLDVNSGELYISPSNKGDPDLQKSVAELVAKAKKQGKKKVHIVTVGGYWIFQKGCEQEEFLFPDGPITKEADATIQAAVDYVVNLLKAREIVIVHCHAGINRSSLVVAKVMQRMEPHLQMLDIVTKIVQEKTSIDNNWATLENKHFQNSLKITMDASNQSEANSLRKAPEYGKAPSREAMLAELRNTRDIQSVTKVVTEAVQEAIKPYQAGKTTAVDEIALTALYKADELIHKK
jgi:hypothetical protein